MWRVSFFQSATPEQLKGKLLASQFFLRSGDPKQVFINGNTVILEVPEAGRDKSAVQKACSQSFKRMGVFENCKVEQCASAGGSSGNMGRFI